MNKFHQIPTDTFVPISYDNSYLFNQYDKVSNFLAFNLDKNYKNILAKPVQNGFFFDWFTVYENLGNINGKSDSNSEIMLLKYWEFIETINNKIKQLSSSIDDNNKNWASLLTKVFNHQNNFIFSDGKEICIVWGWKFDNNEIYKPQISNTTVLQLPVIIDNTPPIYTDFTSLNSFILNDEIINNSSSAVEEISSNKIDEKKLNFLEFLKWFASKYWWLLWLLTILSALTFFIKTFIYFNF